MVEGKKKYGSRNFKNDESALRHTALRHCVICIASTSHWSRWIRGNNAPACRLSRTCHRRRSTSISRCQDLSGLPLLPRFQAPKTCILPVEISVKLAAPIKGFLPQPQWLLLRLLPRPLRLLCLHPCPLLPLSRLLQIHVYLITLLLLFMLIKCQLLQLMAMRRLQLQMGLRLIFPLSQRSLGQMNCQLSTVQERSLLQVQILLQVWMILHPA